MKNLWTLTKHNVEQELGLHTYSLGLNDFSDWVCVSLIFICYRCVLSMFEKEIRFTHGGNTLQVSFCRWFDLRPPKSSENLQ